MFMCQWERSIVKYCTWVLWLPPSVQKHAKDNAWSVQIKALCEAACRKALYKWQLMKNKIFMPISRLFKLKLLEKAGSHTYRSIKIRAALWSYRDGHGQQQHSARLWSLNNTKGLKDIPTPLHQQPEQWIKDPIWSYFLHKRSDPRQHFTNLTSCSLSFLFLCDNSGTHPSRFSVPFVHMRSSAWLCLSR